MGFRFSQNSLDKMSRVHPNLVAFMKELIQVSPFDFKITSGMRTAKEQANLYQQGRIKPGLVVTNADGYKYCSNHQEKVDGYGYAVDVCILKYTSKGDIDWNFKYYKELYEIAKKNSLLEKYGIEWAGNWKKFQEGAHYQLKNARNVAFKK
ncbi:endolysin [Fusobacterium necrophorum subsp. funduliforme]|uniref:Putative peptidoglycan L-alanyl-D-glutamate endopeptidase CwlK n=2 Tax=Fusobacterium TaxID=848 RepID=E5BFD2_9FUSO|nr:MULTISPECIES: M15 family metallopeptidase [Fusobacterium]EFS20813.1 putative peptidoglycan L-alanyl-D-glutamate endopeptidase CwlK [Fusobacterium gonidiaformans 3-1-5R]KXA13529.1 putative peptidoglycan L-alanyl-D-glutamate endopeptidase CwlK [Fusobacterium equinum]KYM54204.1 endolysin [Fusobacterium necrophorum subsp. funduliforme]